MISNQMKSSEISWRVTSSEGSSTAGEAPCSAIRFISTKRRKNDGSSLRLSAMSLARLLIEYTFPECVSHMVANSAPSTKYTPSLSSYAIFTTCFRSRKLRLSGECAVYQSGSPKTIPNRTFSTFRGKTAHTFDPGIFAGCDFRKGGSECDCYDPL